MKLCFILAYAAIGICELLNKYTLHHYLLCTNTFFGSLYLLEQYFKAFLPEKEVNLSVVVLPSRYPCPVSASPKYVSLLKVIMIYVKMNRKAS